MTKIRKWEKGSWREFTALQQPVYGDHGAEREALKKIEIYPPLVFIGEVENLKNQVALAARGRRFILQGGDCAERFIDCSDRHIINTIKIILQMSVILTYGARKPVVRIGRIAGQYSKPRSKPTESLDGREIPTYRGDAINNYEAGERERTPDPQRLILAYFHSVATLNYIRALIAGGFADLHHPYTWNLHSIEKSREWSKYRDTVDRILDAINFMESFGGLNPESLGKIDFFISHEGLILGYEEALTRKDPSSGKFYNLGAHMIWIGDRTLKRDGAHVEYFRGISNPIGLKVSHTTSEDDLADIIETLNPHNEEGRITLITRFGSERVEKHLPQIIRLVRSSGFNVTWSCDPMHGNMIFTGGNMKTRSFDAILEETGASFRIHREMGTTMGGVHFELTGEDVTECTGGAMELKDKDLHVNYDTYCDPRLNYTQSLEMAFLISALLNEK